MIFGAVLAYPFIEEWITGDKREHHLLQRPRNAPTRTAFWSSLMTLYGLLWIAGGNDILAVIFHLDLNYITYFMRVVVFVGPVDRVHHHPALVHLAPASGRGAAAARLRDRHHHALPRGCATPRSTCRSRPTSYMLTARDRDPLLAAPTEADENGVAARKVARSDFGPGCRSSGSATTSRSRRWTSWRGPAPRRARAGRQHEARAPARRSATTPASTQLDGTHGTTGHQFDGRHERCRRASSRQRLTGRADARTTAYREGPAPAAGLGPACSCQEAVTQLERGARLVVGEGDVPVAVPVGHRHRPVAADVLDDVAALGQVVQPGGVLGAHAVQPWLTLA